MNNSIIEQTNPQIELKSDQLIPASLIKRWVASIINTSIFYFMLFLGARLIFAIDEQSEQAWVGALLFMLLYFVMQSYFFYKYKQTFGKFLLKIRVINYIDLQPISFGKCILRETLDIIFGALSLPILISAVVALVSKEKRSLTDAIMGTIVVKNN